MLLGIAYFDSEEGMKEGRKGRMGREGGEERKDQKSNTTGKKDF